MKGTTKAGLILFGVFATHFALSALASLHYIHAMRHGVATIELPWRIITLVFCPVIPLAYAMDYLFSTVEFLAVLVFTSLCSAAILTLAGVIIVRRIMKKNKRPNGLESTGAPPAAGTLETHP